MLKLCFAKTGIIYYQFNVNVKSFIYFESSGLLNFTDSSNNNFEFCFSDFFSYFHFVDELDSENRNITYNNFLLAIRDYDLNIHKFLINDLEGENYVGK